MDAEDLEDMVEGVGRGRDLVNSLSAEEVRVMFGRTPARMCALMSASASRVRAHFKCLHTPSRIRVRSVL